MDFDASLEDLIITHEQYRSSTDESLRLFSSETDENLIVMKCLFTSPENPLFYSEPYRKMENRIHIRLTPAILRFQIEPILQLLTFRDQFQIEEHSPKQSNSKKISVKSSHQMEVEIEQFRMIIGTESCQILHFQFEHFIATVFQSSRKTSLDLLLTNLQTIDLHENARYPHILIPQDHSKQLLHAQIDRYTYFPIHQKTLNEVDCHIKMNLSKINIVLFYRYVDLLLKIVNALQTKHRASSTKKIDGDDSMMKKDLKVRFDVLIEAPTIFIPVHFHSHEGIFIDFGQWNFNTEYLDRPNRSFLEQQTLSFSNFSIRRMDRNTNTEILLLHSAPLFTSINRVLSPQTEAEITVNITWDTIDGYLSKQDYSSMINIYRENFSENIYHHLSSHNQESPSSSDEPIEGRMNFLNNRTSERIRMNFRMKKISLTLFEKKDFEFLRLQMDMINVRLQYLFNRTYHIQAVIQSLKLEHLSPNEEHFPDRNVIVHQNTPVVFLTIQVQSTEKNLSTFIFLINGRLEAFRLFINPDLLIALKHFLSSNQPSEAQTSTGIPSHVHENIPQPAKSLSADQQSAPIPISSSDRQSDLQTTIDLLIKPFQIYWLENPHDRNAKIFTLQVGHKSNDYRISFTFLVVFSSANDDKSSTNSYQWFS